MPISKTKMRNAEIAAKSAALPKLPKELLDQIVGAGAPMTAEQINATTMALKKALIERALGPNRRWPAAHRSPARPRGQLRADPHPQARAPLHWL